MRQKEEEDKEAPSHAFSSCGSFTQPKAVKKSKQRKKLDPVQEKQRQNYECYKEFCKLKIIYSMIEKELVQVKADNEKYDKTLAIMNENKERHEDELGYYLGIEDNRKKRVRRLATEIERKHKCLVPKCPKAYGSEGSLNQHLIRKHPMVYEEWMKRISELESQNSNKKGQISKEEKNKIRKEIEKLAPRLCIDDESQIDNDSD
jgi:ribosomal protein L37AE/L43A